MSVGFKIRRGVEAIEIMISVALSLSKKANERFDARDMHRTTTAIHDEASALDRGQGDPARLCCLLFELRKKANGLNPYTRQGSHAYRLSCAATRTCEMMEALAKAALLDDKEPTS